MTASAFILVLVLWPLVAFAGGLAFSPLVGLVALALMPAARGIRFQPYMAVLAVFFLYAAASALWSPSAREIVDIDLAAGDFNVRSEVLRIGLLVLALGVVCAAGLRLDKDAVSRINLIALVAFSVQWVSVLLLALFEQQALQLTAPLMSSPGEGVQNITRNSLIMTAAAPWFFFALQEWRPGRVGQILSWVMAAGLVFALAWRGVHAGLLAFLFAAGFIAVMRMAPRFAPRILAGFMSLLTLSVPFVFGLLSRSSDISTAETSADWRLGIWARSLEIVAESPIYGGGVRVLRSISDTIQGGAFEGDLVVPNHAHNMFVQLWAEFGAAGAILLAIIIFMAGWRLPVAHRMGTPGLMLAGVIGAVVAISAVTYDLWNDWWWAVSGMLVILSSISVPWKRGRAKRRLAVQPDIPRERAPVALSHHLANNFNLLRLFFAASVAIYHIVYLGGVAPGLTEPDGALAVLASLGVHGFFILSGYLVYASCVNAPSLWSYAVRRMRRLYPAYAVVILASVAGALVFSAEARANQYEVLEYLGWNLVFLNFMEPNLPGLFGDAPISAVNGALWTLKIEVMFYAVLPLLAWALMKAGKYKWAVAAGVYAASELWRLAFTGVGGAIAGPWAETLSYQLPGQMRFFICGIMLYWIRDKRSWMLNSAPFGVALLAASIWLPEYELLRPLALSSVVIWIGLVVPRLFSVTRYGEISYGLYIVHFPIAQALVSVGGAANAPWFYLYAAVTMSVAAAVCLWWLVERPMLHSNSAYRMTSKDVGNILQLFQYRRKPTAVPSEPREAKMLREGA